MVNGGRAPPDLGGSRPRRLMLNYYSPFTIHHLPLEQINLVNEDRPAVAVERDDEAEADGRLGGGDDDDEDREDLTRHGVHVPGVLKVAREGYEVQVRRVQDQLDGHEDDDDVAAHEHAGHADDEQERPDDQELRKVWVLDALPHVLDGRVLKQEEERGCYQTVHKFGLAGPTKAASDFSDSRPQTSTSCACRASSP